MTDVCGPGHSVITMMLPSLLSLVLTLPLVAEPPEVQATRRADVVVVATVSSVKSRVSADGRRVLTEVEVEVTQALKGAPLRRLVLLQRGGRLGDVVTRVSDEVSMTAGERLLVWVERFGSRTHHAFATAAPTEALIAQVRGVAR